MNKTGILLVRKKCVYGSEGAVHVGRLLCLLYIVTWKVTEFPFMTTM